MCESMPVATIHLQCVLELLLVVYGFGIVGVTSCGIVPWPFDKVHLRSYLTECICYGLFGQVYLLKAI